MNIKLQKEAFIEAYRQSFGNVSKSCKAAGWKSRTPYYELIKKDQEFADAIANIEPKEDYVDFLESKLIERINDGDTTAVIFALKTQGKKRGYSEKIELSTEDDAGIKIHIIDDRTTS